MTTNTPRGYLPVTVTVWVDARTKLTLEELEQQLATDIAYTVNGYKYTIKSVSGPVFEVAR